MAETIHTDYDKIYSDFARTPYGERLQRSIRWEKYNTANVSKEAWCDLIGADANNLYHMYITYEVAQLFIHSQNASDKHPIDEAAVPPLLLAAIIHDQGEAVGGDVSYGDKTHDDEANEKRLFLDHLQAMNPAMDSLTRKMAQSAIQNIIFDSSTPEGNIFNAIERTGYFITTLDVAARIPIVEDPEILRGLEWLVTDVLLNQIPALIQHSEIYSLPYELLTENSSTISQLFIDTPNRVFTNYGEEAKRKQDQFIKAQQLWAHFCQTHSL